MSKFKMTRRERDALRAAKQRERIDAMFPDEPPKDMDEFRYALARKIAMFVGERRESWRGCKERVCRRQRVCLAPRNRCSHAPPRPPATPEETARTMAQVSRTVQEVLARQGAAGK